MQYRSWDITQCVTACETIHIANSELPRAQFCGPVFPTVILKEDVLFFYRFLHIALTIGASPLAIVAAEYDMTLQSSHNIEIESSI